MSAFLMDWARQEAARAWCAETTQSKEMDVALAEEFAKILHRECSKPNLGFATTRERKERTMVTVEHVDTWADRYGTWLVLRVIVNGQESTKIVRVT